MSLFFSKISKTFNNQSINNSSQFERIGNSYRDKTFCFDSNNIKLNCFLSNDDKDNINNRNFDLLQDLKLSSWVEEWKEGFQNENYDYKNFPINDMDLNESFNYINANWNNLDLDPSVKKKSLDNLKRILNLKKKDNNFLEEIFKLIFSKKLYKEIYRNRNEKYLEVYRNLFEYKRISPIIKGHYKIFENKIDCTNVKQGLLGTCYFLETISTLSNYGQLLYQLFPQEKLNEKGIYEICLFYEGQWQKVLVDDYFVFIKGTNKFAFTQPINYCLYSCLLEKAYAKIKGSFADINGGLMEKAFEALTGFKGFRINIEQLKNNNRIYNFFFKKIKEGYLFSCSADCHAYSLIYIDFDKKINDKIFEVRNPWSKLSRKESNLFSEFLEDYPKYKGKRENNQGIFFLDKKRFESHFLGGITFCPVLFGWTIFSYQLKDIQDLQNNNNMFFSFEVFEKSKITIGLYGGMIKKNSVKIKEIKDSKALNERNVRIISDFKNEFLSKTNYTNSDDYESFTEIEKSKYLLNIDLTGMSSNQMKNIILSIIIEGNIEKINFLGCHSSEPNINTNPINIIQTSYNYGMETSKLFKKFKKIINVLEKDFNINIHPDSKGFYIETIITGEVETLITLEKETVKLRVCSHDKKEDAYFTGPNQVNGKTEGNGIITKYIEGKEVKVSGYIHENKISCEIIDHKNKEVYFKLRDLLEFTINKTKIKNTFHQHDLLYTNSNKRWKCDFCLRIYDNYKPSFRCNDCDYDLCLDCEFIKNNVFDNFFEKLSKSNKIIKKFNLKTIIVKCPFHKHDLIFQKVYDNKGYICNLCYETYKDKESFHCDECEFDICINCMLNSKDDEETINKLILNDNINKVILGFEKVIPSAHVISDVALFLPRVLLPSNIITNKQFLHASFYIKTKLGFEIALEYGKYDETKPDIIYNNKSYKAFYPRCVDLSDNKNSLIYKTNEGIRIIKMDKNDYIQNKIKDDSYSKRLFNIEVDYSKRLYDLLFVLGLFNQKEDFSYLFHNSNDFAAQFIKVTGGHRKEGTDHRGFHNLSSTMIPEPILVELENNENDGWNTAGKIPVIGPVAGLFHLIGKKITDP